MGGKGKRERLLSNNWISKPIQAPTILTRKVFKYVKAEDRLHESQRRLKVCPHAYANPESADIFPCEAPHHIVCFFLRHSLRPLNLKTVQLLLKDHLFQRHL